MKHKIALLIIALIPLAGCAANNEPTDLEACQIITTRSEEPPSTTTAALKPLTKGIQDPELSEYIQAAHDGQSEGDDKKSRVVLTLAHGRCNEISR